MSEMIKSRANEAVKEIKKLNSSSAYRRERGLFALEGLRLCRDAAESKIEIKTLFYTEKALSAYGGELSDMAAYAECSAIISEDISDYLSETKSPQGVFCIAKAIDKKTADYKTDKNGVYILLENIQDPANLGAIARTAEALGVSGIFISGGCDIYNPKAQRASMGALLRINIFQVDNAAEKIKFLRAEGFKVFASTPRENAVKITEISCGGVVCVIGNEGAGVSEESFNACNAALTIPMRGKAESLNAGAAASIIMWELLKR